MAASSLKHVFVKLVASPPPDLSQGYKTTDVPVVFFSRNWMLLTPAEYQKVVQKRNDVTE